MEFGVLTGGRIRQMSVAEVTTPLGSRAKGHEGEGGVMDKRLTELDHFGHIELGLPVPNALFIRVIVNILNCVTVCCYRRRGPHRLSDMSSLQELSNVLSKVTECEVCGTPQPTWVEYDGFYIRPVFDVSDGRRAPKITPIRTYEILAELKGEDFGICCNPAELMWSAFPVPPIAIRPGKDDLTLRLRAIVRANNNLDDEEPVLNAYHRDQELYNSVQDAQRRQKRALRSFAPYAKLCRETAAYQDNAIRPRNTPVYGKLNDSLGCRYKGSKLNRIRGSLTTKCVNWMARAVCVPSGLLHINQVGVPRWVCDLLQITEGDYVVMNRQPTLHRNSILGFRVHVTERESNVFELHLAVTPGFNLDFDGDEMNLHAPKSAAAIRDVRERMLVDFNLMVDDAPVVQLVMNAVLGAYHMSDPATVISRQDLCQMLASLPFIEALVKPTYSGLEAFSFILPIGLSFEFEDVVVRNGQMLAGRWTKKTLNNTGGLLWAVFHHLAPSDAATWVGHAYAFISCFLTRVHGASFGLGGLAHHGVGGLDGEGGAYPLDCAQYIDSGAKGKPANLVQLRDELGAQLDFQGRSFAPTCHGGDGYIKSSFCKGLNPVEHFYHLAASRACLVDTAVQTGDTGTLQRNLTFALEDVVRYANGRVADSAGRIYALEDPEEPPAEGVPAVEQFGLITSASIIAPVTQANLRTFHQAGKDAHLTGLPRLKQLLACTATDVREVLDTYGVEVCRGHIRDALTKVLSELGCPATLASVSLLADFITRDGRLTPVSFRGVQEAYGSVLKTAAFQRPMATLAAAALRGAEDPACGPTEQLILGRRVVGPTQGSGPHQPDSPIPLTTPYSPSYAPLSPSYPAEPYSPTRPWAPGRLDALTPLAI